MLSALAIDVADTAVLGAVAAAASGAVLAGSSTSKAKSGAADSSEGDEGEAEGETRITGAGKPGLVIAAGLLSAFDAGKSMVDVLNGTDTDKPDEGNPEGDAAADE